MNRRALLLGGAAVITAATQPASLPTMRPVNKKAAALGHISGTFSGDGLYVTSKHGHIWITPEEARAAEGLAPLAELFAAEQKARSGMFATEHMAGFFAPQKKAQRIMMATVHPGYMGAAVTDQADIGDPRFG